MGNSAARIHDLSMHDLFVRIHVTLKDWMFPTGGNKGSKQQGPNWSNKCWSIAHSAKQRWHPRQNQHCGKHLLWSHSHFLEDTSPWDLKTTDETPAIKDIKHMSIFRPRPAPFQEPLPG
jgi:hypothetical protein